MKTLLFTLAFLEAILQTATAHRAHGSDLAARSATHHKARRTARSFEDDILNQLVPREAEPRRLESASRNKRAQSDITWQTSPFNPTSIPLAVRSPYLSTWLWGGTNDRFGDLTTQQPSFWNGNTLPWCGTALVDGQAYTWMGVPSNCAPGGIQAKQLSMSFTSSKTTFTLQAGTANINVTFTSPLTPQDLVRQSLPYSYMEVTASSNDGQSHDVQIYTDITGEWASNDWSRNITWGKIVLNSTIHVHQFQLLNETTYGEVKDSTTYGKVVYATSVDANTTYMSGPSSTIRQTFVTQGRLANYADTNYRAIQDSQPAFGYSKDLGAVTASRNGSAVFALGHYREPAVQYTASKLSAPQSERSLYFMTQYPSMESSLFFFYDDYATVTAMTTVIDEQVQADAAAAAPGNSNYPGLCAISARQILGGLEITVGKTSSGAYNASDIMVFVKEIATSNYINTVDVIAPFFPFLAYFNPELIAHAILPVVEYVEVGDFPNSILSAPHDIGTAYPIADGAHQVDAPYYIEESANMLFMALAHQRYTQSDQFIRSHYTVLKQWADYLVNSTLNPIYQASTDDFAGQLAQMTSLAIKGNVGLGCMGEIAKVAGQTDDATHYSTTAANYVPQIIESAMSTSRDHLKLTYNATDDSWSSLYNLLPDKLFNLGLFNESFYEMQGRWYASQALPYGIPLDSRAPDVKTDFAMWTSAIYSNNATLRDLFINGVHDFLAYGESGQAVPDLYNGQNASQVGGFVARPVVGGIYAPMAVWSLQSNATLSVSSAGSTNLNNGQSHVAQSSARRRWSILFW